jgi:predicted lipoprotein with Yx(FWY)xxD motif
LRSPRPSVVAVVILVLAGAGCGGSDGTEQPQTNAGPSAVTEPMDTAAGERGDEPANTAVARRPPGEDGLRVAAKRARIIVKESRFGRVLFDANGQAIYLFEIDRSNRSNCTSEACVEAWPPVLTREPPTAGPGADAGLLGTIRRGEGGLQVTYNGRPLYFYEHESPGEIKCHNVDLHGGTWWVVTARGDPAV